MPSSLATTIPMATVPMSALAQSDESETKLSIYNAYRFRAIMEEATERLDLLGLVTADSSHRKKDDNQGRNKKDVYHLMVNQKDLENRYEELMLKRSQLHGLQNKSKYLQNQSELEEIATQLRESTSSIYQNLKDQPTVAGNLHKIQKDRSDVQELLSGTISDLKVGMFSSLVQQVNERIEKQDSLSETQATHEKKREALKKLEQELRAERENFARATEAKNLEIQALTQELKQLKKVTALSKKYETDTALAKRETIARTRKRRLDDLREQIAKTQEGVTRDTTVNDSTIKYLHKKRSELDTLAEQWDGKYETDHGQLTEDLETLTQERDTDNLTLTKLQERWTIDKSEKAATNMEKQQRLVELLNQKKLLKIMNLAQAKINFVFRVYKKSKPKGRKGKKGKKGSKKKGKVTVKG